MIESSGLHTIPHINHISILPAMKGIPVLQESAVAIYMYRGVGGGVVLVS